MGLDSALIAIVEFQLRSVGDMRDQLAIRLRSMRSSSNLLALWTDRHRPLCKRVNRRRSWRSRKSVRDQSAINYRFRRFLRSTWRSMALSQSATDRRLVEYIRQLIECIIMMSAHQRILKSYPLRKQNRVSTAKHSIRTVIMSLWFLKIFNIICISSISANILRCHRIEFRI